jgi:hypothetical protein
MLGDVAAAAAAAAAAADTKSTCTVLTYMHVTPSRLTAGCLGYTQAM